MALIPVAIAAVGAYQQAQGQKQQAQYQAKVAENNAKVAEWQAADAKERGDVAAAAVRRKYAALQGTQAASLAARGLDIGEGSANAILSDTDFFGDYDQRTTRSNAQREAWGFKVRAGNFRGDAGAYGATADAINPYVSGALAGASAYIDWKNKNPDERGPWKPDRADDASRAGGSDNLLYDAAPVSDRWYS